MKKKEKERFREEERITGWRVCVYFNAQVSNAWGHNYQKCETFDVDTWSRAKEIAESISNDGTAKFQEGEEVLFVRNFQDEIAYTKIGSITETIYIKEG